MADEVQALEVVAGDILPVVITITDSSGTAVDVTGYTADMIQFIVYSGSTALITKNITSGVTLTTPASGIVTATLSTTDTATMSGSYAWVCKVTPSAGLVYTVALGFLTAYGTPSVASNWLPLMDLKNATGTALDDTILKSIIDGAEREIVARLAPLNITGDSSLREASLHLSIARLYTRYHIGGELTSGEIASNIANHEALAWELVERYISAQDRTRDVKTWVRVG